MFPEPRESRKCRGNSALSFPSLASGKPSHPIIILFLSGDVSAFLTDRDIASRTLSLSLFLLSSISPSPTPRGGEATRRVGVVYSPAFSSCLRHRFCTNRRRPWANVHAGRERPRTCTSAISRTAKINGMTSGISLSRPPRPLPRHGRLS